MLCSRGDIYRNVNKRPTEQILPLSIRLMYKPCRFPLCPRARVWAGGGAVAHVSGRAGRVARDGRRVALRAGQLPTGQQGRGEQLTTTTTSLTALL